MIKIRNIGMIIFVIFLILYLSIQLFTFIKLSTVKSFTKTENPEITKIESVHRIGHWGEWFSEYTLVVEIDKEMYRIWVDEYGVITGKEPLE